jgi:leader peptidase (prepilin peptidase)/N-methyltransferase
MIALVFGLFGLIIGSFLNVVILRYGKQGIGGRSACPSCGTPLRWFEMFPVASWLFLRGRCRTCRARISAQYPLVELATALLFAALGAAPFPADILHRMLFCAIAALLICIFVYDLYHKLIPDLWVYAFDALALVAMGPILLAFAPDAPLWLYLAAGPIAALPLFALWLVSRGAWMGFGDVKLALGMGWLLGPALGFVAVMFAFVIGAVVSVGILLPMPAYRRMIARFTPRRSSPLAAAGFTMQSEVPFGPFLIASCLILWFAFLYNIPVPLIS